MTIVRKYDILILDLSNVPLIGVTASLAVENMVKDSCEKKRQVFLVGATGQVKQRLQDLNLLKLIPPENRFDNRLDALTLAQAIIQSI